ncbi:MAG: hypothetical protein K0U78_20505 [Actinomycetia bacterium]|nr:hypothetical protein [Actinomycetes bacterium]
MDEVIWGAPNPAFRNAAFGGAHIAAFDPRAGDVVGLTEQTFTMTDASAGTATRYPSETAADHAALIRRPFFSAPS